MPEGNGKKEDDDAPERRRQKIEKLFMDKPVPGGVAMRPFSKVRRLLLDVAKGMKKEGK
jgi:hypothetical protein